MKGASIVTQVGTLSVVLRSVGLRLLVLRKAVTVDAALSF